MGLFEELLLLRDMNCHVLLECLTRLPHRRHKNKIGIGGCFTRFSHRRYENKITHGGCIGSVFVIVIAVEPLPCLQAPVSCEPATFVFHSCPREGTTGASDGTAWRLYGPGHKLQACVCEGLEFVICVHQGFATSSCSSVFARMSCTVRTPTLRE